MEEVFNMTAVRRVFSSNLDFERKLAQASREVESEIAQNGGKLPEIKEIPDTRSNAQKAWAQFPSGGNSGTE